MNEPCPSCGVDAAALQQRVMELEAQLLDSRAELRSMTNARNRYYTQATGDPLPPGALMQRVLDMD